MVVQRSKIEENEPIFPSCFFTTWTRNLWFQQDLREVFGCSKRWCLWVVFFFTLNQTANNGPFTRPKRRRAGGTLLKTSQILWILPALDRCLWKICRSTTGAGLYDLPYRLSSASSVNLLKLLKVGTIHWFWNAKRSSGDRLPVPICLSLIFVIVCFIHGHILNQLIWLICHIYIYHSLLSRPDFVYHWLGVGSSVACS